MRRHKVKQESAATSSHHREEEHDLAYYIHDRVELMHQVFSVIKPKELKAMAPSCVQLISIDNLQELCTEELLGISSKRLCAILDGAEPPTDTESSSSEQLETISLDSISSDDDILSQPEAKKKHKHKKKNKPKNRRKHKHSSESEEDKGNQEQSKANRAGLTVLELLELQARARAIRAQLQKDNASKAEGSAEQEGEKEHSSDEVEIKEEPPEIFEISSDEEKPKLEELQKLLEKPSATLEKTSEKRTVTKTVTKVVNDLTITVPTKPTHKIRLNRNRLVKSSTSAVKDVQESVTDKTIDMGDTRKPKSKKDSTDIPKKKKKKNKNKDGSDHDEITLQLSDTEKMDLLEDLDRKNFDNFTSSEDSGSSSSENGMQKIGIAKVKNTDIVNSTEIIVCELNKDTNNEEIIQNNNKNSNKADKEIVQNNSNGTISLKESDVTEDNNKENTITESGTQETSQKDKEIIAPEEKNNTHNEQMEDGEIKSNKDLSEGEISDKDTSKESEKQIVCISDDEIKTHRKKTKKDKKCKKDKKKTKSDFHESGDQNFFRENDAFEVHSISKDVKCIENTDKLRVDDNFDADLCEVLELSDSDFDVDITVSQEPTADEIKALSAKIDEIDPNEQTGNMGEVESWRDRYLDSKKVKKVLTTANLLNALRKKNKELKNKLEVKPQDEETEKKIQKNDTGIDGTIEQFNTLQGSTKYVDPVVEEKKMDEEVTKEMKKDAKQLLKMYKMLLKYNDINKRKDPNRKKKKKQKQKKSKEKQDVVEDKCVVSK